MPIRFLCTCGKHLSAADRMAGRRSVCPACGAAVGIPAREATHREGKERPLSVLEPAFASAEGERMPARVRTNRSSRATPPKESVFVVSLRDVHEAHLRGGWRGETEWNDSLQYVLVHTRVLRWLAAGFALWTLIGISLQTTWLRSLDGRDFPYGWLLVWGAMTILLAAAVATFFQGVLALSAAGKSKAFIWPDVLEVRWGDLGSWAVGLLAGPIVPLLFAARYWLRCGDPLLADWLILLELIIPALGYWLIGMLVASTEGTMFVPPSRILEMATRLQRPLIGAGVSATAIFLGHLWLVGAGLRIYHNAAPIAFVLLWFSWFGVLIAGAFTLRRLGLAANRSRRKRRK